MRGKERTAAVDRTVAAAEMVDRLAFAACGAKLWPNQYAQVYHRAAVRRMINIMTPRDLDLIAGMIRK